MENEVVVLLRQILSENQEMRNEISGLKNEILGLKEEMAHVKGEISSLKGEMTNVQNEIIGLKDEMANVKCEVSDLKIEVGKNSINIEKLGKKIDVIAEVQTSHKEQSQKQFEELTEEIHERFDVLETATKNISKDLRDVQDEVKALAEISGRHEMDIMVLKRRPV